MNNPFENIPQREPSSNQIPPALQDIDLESLREELVKNGQAGSGAQNNEGHDYTHEGKQRM